MQPPRLVVWLCASLFCGLSAARSAQAEASSSPVARLFRAQIGDSTATLQAALKAESWQWSATRNAIVTHETEDLSFETTYWLKDGRVSRIYRVVQLSGTELAPFELAYQILYQRVERAAGRVPDQAQALPTWFSTLGSSKYAELVKNRLVQSASWNLDATLVRVFLRAERGAAIVLLSAEPLTGCSDQTLASALLELHPPATPERRAASARTVALCARERGAGALAAALLQDPEVSVRVELVRSLGRVSSPTARTALVNAAREDSSPEIQKESLRTLVASNAADEAKAIAADKHQPASLRRLAEEVLAEVAPPMPPTPPVAAPAATATVRLAPPSASKPQSPPTPPQPVAKQAGATVRLAPPSATPPQPVVAKQAPVASAVVAPKPAMPLAAPAPLPPGAPVASAVVAPKPAMPLAAPAPLPPAVPVLPPEPEKPAGPADGTTLAIVTSAVAGGVWGGGLSLLAQQDNPGVVALLGGAGAVIGGGTAWGITRFGLRPTFDESFFFANSTAWGALAGLMAWQASGSDNPKLKYGLLVGGESVGLSMGILGARLWDWTPGQILLANSLLLGAGLAGMGTNRLMDVDWSSRMSPAAGYSVAPAMVAAAIAARYLPVTGNDLALMGMGGLWGGWTGSLIASGASGTSLLGDHQGQGGALLGLGAGYLGMAALSPWVELRPRTLLGMTGGMAAGNLLGLGVGLLAEPKGTHAALGAGIGGLGYAVGALALAPHIHLGPEWGKMMVAGAAYGAGSWALASAAAGSDTISNTRLVGGALVGGVAGGTLGLVASEYFHPSAADAGTMAAATGAGLSMGLGLAKLTTEKQGVPELVGVLSGSALGLVGGAAFTHASQLRPPSVLAGVLGGGYGLFVGTLAPTLGDPSWSSSRRTSGGSWLGLGLGAAGATAWGQWQGISYQKDLMLASAGTLGLGMGYGAGLLWSNNNTRPARIGAVAGPAVLAGGALLLDRSLHLSDGLGMNALPVAGMGVAMGLLNGGLLADVVAKGDPQNRQVGGGLLLGASAGLAGGLVLSKLVQPAGQDYFLVSAGNLLGLSLGQGIGRMAVASDRQDDFLPPLRLAGALTGAAGATLASHGLDWRWADNLALTYGTAFGGLMGTFVPSVLAPSLIDSSKDKRFMEGGATVGMAVGGLAAASAAHASGASPAQINFAAAATSLGVSAGLGLGMALPNDSSQPERIGLVAGGLGFAVGAVALDHKLHLSNLQDLNEPALLTLAGGVAGGVEGMLLAGAMDPHGLVGKTPGRRLGGGILFGTSLGASSGFLLSRFTRPDQNEILTSMLGGALGGGLGLGVAMLSTRQAGRGDTLATMGGSIGALAGSAALAHVGALRLDAPALFTGLAYGGLIGTLSPGLADHDWPGWTRKSTGGLLAGTAGGALTASVIARATDASPAHTGFTALAGLDGLLGGLGFGLLLDDGSTRGARIGTVAGSAAGLAAGAILFPRLHLDDINTIVPLTVAGAVIGGVEGALLAGAVDSRGLVGKASASRLGGGILFGTSLGASSGFLLSRVAHPDKGEIMTSMLGGGLGGGLGLGVSMLSTAQAGRSDTLAAMGGSLGALAGSAALAHFGELHLDAPALFTGLAYGGFIGTLSPSLGDEKWPGWTRKTTGGLLAGSAGGALTASVIAGATHVSPAHTGFAALAGLDGLLGGLGFGLLLDDSSQGARIGTVAGSAAGLVAGAALFPHLQLESSDAYLISGLTALGVWNGVWAPTLGHARSGEVSSRRYWGGALAGGASAALIGTGLASFLTVDTDLLANAALMNVMLAGAGAGAGAMLSPRYDAPVIGMLGGGLAGLTLGGALHDQIHIDSDDTPWLVLAPLEGLWLGAWLPRAIYRSEDVNQRRQIGGLVTGGLGGAALATLTSHWVKPTANEAGVVGLSSAMGASLAGGSVLLADDLHDRRGVGILLGGTAVGLGVGAVLAPRLTLDPELGAYMAGGALLGGSEGLVFAWAARGSTQADYAGAGLLGLGVGATLGMTHGFGSSQAVSRKLAAGGFAAWGAWVGAFSGALANRDPHEVTMGGLAGANLGAIVGYGLLSQDWVEPRDFGWLSLFGAAGTVLGGGVGAIFSSRTDPRPVLAGLTIGPAVGITVGAIVLPRLRSIIQRDSGKISFFNFGRRQVASMSVTLGPASATDLTSADVLATRSRPGFFSRVAHGLGQAFEVTQWSPFVGALPATPGDPSGSSPFIFGVSGNWK